jgi:hypothetical protein
MHPNKKDNIFDMNEDKNVMLEYCINTKEFEKTMKEYYMVMARAQMGGSIGIHKPTSGNPDRLRR